MQFFVSVDVLSCEISQGSGDPHFVTFDGRMYSFNGFGEYIMMQYNNNDPFVLQTRTGVAFRNGEPVNTGTVFTGFAATQGITNVSFTLNDDRTELLLSVNQTSVDISTLEADGYDSADPTFNLHSDDEAAESETAIIVTFKLPDIPSSGLRVVFRTGILLGNSFVPREYATGGIGNGLFGLMNGDKNDDFQYRDGTIIMDTAERNLTGRDIFDFGQSWMISPSESLFDYGDRDWSYYNDPDYVPPFLSELIAADPDLAAQAKAFCGDSEACLFDSLAVDPSVGLDTLSSNNAFEIQLSDLNNFPPNITSVIETSSTDALSESGILRVIVDQTVTLQITASDPNDEDVVQYSLQGAQSGATIDQNTGLFTWTPPSLDVSMIEIVATDDFGASTLLTYKVRVCQCSNDGVCNFDNLAANQDLNNNGFTVVTCTCDVGWSGDHCGVDFDSCQRSPCYEGVFCSDLPPPSVMPMCGPCPPSLTGDGLTCFDVDECANDTLNECDQNCDNRLNGYDCTCNDGFTLDMDQRRCNDINECILGTHGCQNNSLCNNTIGSYQCYCEVGFSPITNDNVNCEDIDECTVESPCDVEAMCGNNEGSFICTCNEGYVGDGTTCTDMNECLDESLNDCASQATCDNSPGSFSCVCDGGWVGNGTFCEDANECSTNDDDCSDDATCENNPGSYLCICNAGYVGNGIECFDIDECASEDDNCTMSALCVNTNGSFECRCADGYIQNLQGECEDANECDDDPNCDMDAQCVNTNGSFVCSCNEGFQGNGFACEDIDECTLGTHDCQQSCINDSPGFNCSCFSGFILMNDNKTCMVTESCDLECGSGVCINSTDGEICVCDQTGYEFNSTINNCTDVNECLGENRCEMDCDNIPGGYVCSCVTGFLLDVNGRSCSDRDECLDGTQDCDTNAACSNTEGSFSCLCNDGYTENGAMCTNTDECLSTSPCHVFANCMDTNGSFNCMCMPGFSGNGFSCVDNNECDQSPCDENAACNNTDGSFSCTCLEGYTGNGLSCSNINECEVDPPCGVYADCSDNEGSFTCSCLPGFQGDPYAACTDIIECQNPSLFTCHQLASCVNTLGNYSCECNNGYEGDGISCSDQDECSDVLQFCGPNSNCSNSVGSYECMCSEGYVRENMDSNCTDFNECDNVQNTCPPDISSCVNTDGDFMCTCGSGYQNDSPKTCNDTNECAESTRVCSDSRECINTVGHFRCICTEGFAEIGGSCEASLTLQLRVRFEAILGALIAANPSIIESATNQEQLERDMLMFLQGISELGESVYMATISDVNVTSPYAVIDFRTDVETTLNINDTVLESLFNNALPDNRRFGVSGAENIVNQEDVDECADDPVPCTNGMCTNTIGSFFCTCNDGYIENGARTACIDIDECEDDSTLCAKGTCFNTAGSYTCNCDVGFQLDGTGVNCEDIIECDAGNLCANGMCENNEGSYMCLCIPGFAVDSTGTECQDVNECDDDSSLCVDGTCNNIMGTYSCDCNNGYEKSINGKACNDIDECANIPNPCGNGTCNNIDGTYGCTCDTGFEANESGTACNDINECAGNANPCVNGECTNTDGSYMCTCGSGFRLSVDGSTCDAECGGVVCQNGGACGSTNQCDCANTGFTGTLCENNIDECDSNPCMNGGSCADEVKSFTCSCADGYTGTLCGTDIDECANIPNPCGNGTCNNIDGTYECTCDTGFEANESGTACDDVDECAGDDNPCVNGDCTNTDGTYMCTCGSGFRLSVDGSTCDAECGGVVCQNGGACGSTNQCDCANTGFTGTLCENNIVECDSNPCMNGGSCADEVNSFTCSCADGYTGTLCGTDIDECANIPNPCGNGTCNNIDGTYECTCDSGFEANDSGTACDDVDECAGDDNPCVNGDCTNTDGTYMCTCGSGFRLSVDGSTCDAECGGAVCQNGGACGSTNQCDCANTGFTGTLCETNIDECNSNPCTNGGSCADEVNSFTCSCADGYTGTLCGTDVNECELDSSLCNNGRCVNLDGSYTCICNAGFTLVNANSCNAFPRGLSTSQVTVKITGQSLNGQTLTYTPELTDRSSAKFIEYEVAFCYIFSQYVKEQLGSQLVDANCIVRSFSQGSVVGDVQVQLAAESQSVADGLAVSLSALSTNIDQNLSANGQTLVASISAEVQCDQSNCQNGGECTSSGQPCNCPAGFTGDLCQNASQGLSNGAIIGIALGVFGFVLVLITCVCCVFVQGVRQNQATKLMLAEQRYDNPSRQNRGFYGNESFNGSDEYNSLEGRRYAVGQALDRLRRTDVQHHGDRNFRTPYVVDGSETYNGVERNPMHY
ncbi:fibrillin-1 isoform X2 [Strongylocentrotus purpuratus]|uniref:Fibrillin-2-like n=1 Tax=Strongylocentrotus purpuratus TaxID=7668 RepID=A0A7M7P1P6_STRPU|nr:fibrillin-1 isoform X2 [Strongylocentrotus purpuratus]